jgi:sterol desaturase/sphingolipid hydroxylase (fatty acid hydroxylase superfamily)
MPLEIAAVTPTSSSDTIGPLTQVFQQAVTYVSEHGMEYVPRDLQLDVVLLTLTIAIFIWFIRKGAGSKDAGGRERKSGLLQFLFPKDIYTHQSARVDLWLWITERLLHPFLGLGVFVAVGPVTEQLVISALEYSFGASPALISTIGWMLLYSLTTFLCYDFVFFITHYTMHKVPALWAIHKVHHSAEVLTPLTRYREHFVAVPIWAAGGGFSYGVAAGIFGYLFAGDIVEATLLNVSFFAILFGFNGAFRHYHVQFHYPQWLAKWVHSPVMHHVHHSYLEKHWDKNFAAVTSIWDRIFGCLYIPEKDEYTPWGIPPKKQLENKTYWQNMIGPFRDWYRMLNGRYGKVNEIETTDELKY